MCTYVRVTTIRVIVVILHVYYLQLLGLIPMARFGNPEGVALHYSCPVLSPCCTYFTQCPLLDHIVQNAILCAVVKVAFDNDSSFNESTASYVWRCVVSVWLQLVEQLFPYLQIISMNITACTCNIK